MAGSMTSGALISVADRRGRVVDFLRASGRVDPSAMSRAEAVSARTGQPVEQVLNQLGSLSDDDLAGAYAGALGLQVWDPARSPILIDPAELGVSPEFLRRARVAPIASGDESGS